MAASKLGPGGRQCAQALFPIAFESTSAEMVMGIDGSVAAFGAALALRARRRPQLIEEVLQMPHYLMVRILCTGIAFQANMANDRVRTERTADASQSLPLPSTEHG